MTTTLRETPKLVSPRLRVSKGFVTIAATTILLFLASGLVAPSSVHKGALLNMLAFAAILAIVGLGQMLVVQQGGIDLSVAGGVSLAVVVVSHQPNGDNAKLLPAVLLALLFAIAAGAINGLLVARLGLNAIIATLGMNALLYGVVLWISGGTPRTTTSLLAAIASNTSLWIVPNSVLFVVAILVVLMIISKQTAAGRRSEAIGANPAAARAIGLRTRLHQSAAYVWAQVLYCAAGILLAGIVTQPSAYQGDSYLLPSVAVVVLGGTSLLGGRGFPVATVVAALFLTQLGQFVLALGVPTAVQTLVQALALAIGVAVYTVDWSAVRRRLLPQRRVPAVST